MSLQRVAAILKSNALLIFLISLFCVGVSAAFASFVTPKFEARTQLYVSASSVGGNASDLANGATFSTQIVNSYADVAKTRIVLDPVISELNLGTTSEELANKITVSAPQGSVLLEISVNDDNAQRAADIANSAARNLKKVVEEKLEVGGPKGGSLVNLTVTEEASAPEVPKSPKPVLDLFIGLVLGLLLSIGIAITRDILDTRIRSLEDVEAASDVPLLGGILDEPNVENNPLTMQVRPESPRAESFRALRTNLQFLNLGGGPQTYVMTSANPSEGKSTTSANLALSLAEAGSRVVLIEADLRLPKVHEYLGVESESGLSDLLVGRVDLEDVVERWGRSSLYFLPAGKIPPNPSELLGSTEMQSLIERLGHEYDYVIVDAPPILSVTDAAVIGHHTRGALVAVAAGITRKPELTSAISTLTQAGVNPEGIIVTRLPQKDAAHYGYGKYGYGKYGQSREERAFA